MAENSVRGWLNSPSHKAALLEPSVSEIGLGCYLGFREVMNLGRVESIWHIIDVGELGNPNR